MHWLCRGIFGEGVDMSTTTSDKPFLSDVAELRRRAREHLDRGALTESYGGDVDTTIDILQNVLATRNRLRLALHDALDRCGRNR